MGTTTNGQICFGIALIEDYEFPWADTHEDGVEAWWREQCGYKPSIELFDEHGAYLNGVKPTAEAIAAYFSEQREFDAARPMPFELVNYCSSECPMYALAVPGTVITARRGYPEKIDPTAFVSDVDADKLSAFMAFCADMGIGNDPDWMLTSYWG